MTQQTRIYLDYNSTTPIYPEVIEGVTHVMTTLGNPSSIHTEGRQARKLVEKARISISKLINCQPKQIIFTSGATESNNMILKGYLPHRKLIVSSTEHPSVLNACPDVTRLKVQSNGIIDLNHLEDLIKKDNVPSFVSIMRVNNETGVIQPIKEISKILSKYDCIFHTDAAQAIGRIEVDFQSLGVDFLSLSGHKMGAPQGVGVVVTGSNTNIPSLIHGGGQERSQRAGTENVAAIHGLGIAAEISLKNLAGYQKLAKYQSQIETALKEFCPDTQINGEDAPRVANTTSACLKDFDTQNILMNLDIGGIAVSAGSACSSGTTKASHVLSAMGHSEGNAKSGLRISTGWATTQDDIDAFISAFKKIITRLSK